MEERAAQIRELLKTQGCTHILVSDITDVQYICGFKSSNAAVLISKKNNVLLTDFRYKLSAELFIKKNPEWKLVILKESLYSSLSSLIPPGSVIGYQSGYLTVDNFFSLKKSLKKCKYIPLSSEVSLLLAVKFKKEITLMQKAASIGDAALEEVVKLICTGMSEIDLACKLDKLCSEMGSEHPSFETIVLFGERSALPHGRPGKRKLKKGDFILIDFGCTVGGFCSDMTRTFVSGKADEKHKFVYNVVKEAQEAARKAACAGMAADELDNKARKPIESAGYGEEFGHALGHGVGLRVHEAPRVSPHVSITLQESMVVTIEPGIYIPEFGGVRIEDMIELRKTGSRILTSFPRNLMEIS